MENKKLVEEIKTVLDETGINPRKWTKLANELNNRSILTKGGKLWTLMNLKNFCEKHIPIEDSIVTDIQMSDKDNIDESGVMEGEEPNDIGLDTLVIQGYDSSPSDSISADIQLDDSKFCLLYTSDAADE